VTPDQERQAILAAGVITAVSGLVMMAQPKRCLGMAGAATPEPAPFVFGVVGMFMAISGMIEAQGATGTVDRRILQFGVAQKMGATAAVVLGVKTKRYKKRALLIAAFDAASGALIAGSLVKSRR
jgi:hypothetical protein